MKIVLFEDDRTSLLHPLALLRPVFDLRCGAFTLRRKLQEKFPDCELHMEARAELAEVASDAYGTGAVNDDERLEPDDDVLLVNAAAILGGPPTAYTSEEQVGVNADDEFVWGFLRADTVSGYDVGSARELANVARARLHSVAVEDMLLRYPWDLVNANPAQIGADFEAAYTPGLQSELHPGATVLGDPDSLYIGPEVEIQPFVVIDCRRGPVIIEKGAKLMAYTSVEGPAFVGPDTLLARAHLHGGASVGPVCRIGGEVEQTIFQGHSNKCHSGFLGHSFIGEWTNLGALTTNSDLKNDYSSVEVRLDGEMVDTESLKTGCFIGDHTKTSIGTLLNTGTVIGAFCNLLAGGGLLPKFVPSFCWYLRGRVCRGRGLTKVLETARVAMGRRGVELTDAMVRLVRLRAEELAESEENQEKAG